MRCRLCIKLIYAQIQVMRTTQVKNNVLTSAIYVLNSDEPHIKPEQRNAGIGKSTTGLSRKPQQRSVKRIVIWSIEFERLISTAKNLLVWPYASHSSLFINLFNTRCGSERLMQRGKQWETGRWGMNGWTMPIFLIHHNHIVSYLHEHQIPRQWLPGLWRLRGHQKEGERAKNDGEDTCSRNIRSVINVWINFMDPDSPSDSLILEEKIEQH